MAQRGNMIDFLGAEKIKATNVNFHNSSIISGEIWNT